MHSLGIVQWNSTWRDHPGNPGRVSGSGPVRVPIPLNMGCFYDYYNFLFVAIMLKIKTGILNSKSGDCHILICAICIHVSAWATT